MSEDVWCYEVILEKFGASLFIFAQVWATFAQVYPALEQVYLFCASWVYFGATLFIFGQVGPNLAQV